MRINRTKSRIVNSPQENIQKKLVKLATWRGLLCSDAGTVVVLEVVDVRNNRKLFR